MKLTALFIILNRKLNEKDFIRNAMKLKENSATKRLYDDYRKMFKFDTFIMYCGEESPIISNRYVQFIGKIQLLEVNYFM